VTDVLFPEDPLEHPTATSNAAHSVSITFRRKTFSRDELGALFMMILLLAAFS
jgi:hypothetical protein